MACEAHNDADFRNKQNCLEYILRGRWQFQYYLNLVSIIFIKSANLVKTDLSSESINCQISKY